MRIVVILPHWLMALTATGRTADDRRLLANPRAGRHIGDDHRYELHWRHYREVQQRYCYVHR
jgi:hypothetical protein